MHTLQEFKLKLCFQALVTVSATLTGLLVVAWLGRLSNESALVSKFSDNPAWFMPVAEAKGDDLAPPDQLSERTAQLYRNLNEGTELLQKYAKQHGAYPASFAELIPAGSKMLIKTLSDTQVRQLRTLVEPSLRGVSRSKGLATILFREEHSANNQPSRGLLPTPDAQLRQLCHLGPWDMAYGVMDKGRIFILLANISQGYFKQEPGVKVRTNLMPAYPLDLAGEQVLVEVFRKDLHNRSSGYAWQSGKLSEAIDTYITTSLVLRDDEVSARLEPYFLAACTGINWPDAGYCLGELRRLGLAPDLDAIALDQKRSVTVRLAVSLALLRSGEENVAVRSLITVLNSGSTNEKIGALAELSLSSLHNSNAGKAALEPLLRVSKTDRNPQVRDSARRTYNLLRCRVTLFSWAQDLDNLIIYGLNIYSGFTDRATSLFTEKRKGLQQLVEQAKQLNEPTAIAAALNNVACCYWYEHNYAEAARLYEEAASQLKPPNDTDYSDLTISILENELQSLGKLGDEVRKKQVIQALKHMGKEPLSVGQPQIFWILYFNGLPCAHATALSDSGSF